MAINVARIKTASEIRWAVVKKEGYIPIPGEFQTTRDFILHGRETAFFLAKKNDTNLIPFAEAACLCPITQNQQYVCQGANYVSHMLEAGVDPSQKGYNMIFRKASSCLAPADTDIIRPDHVTLLDYELELGLVLARDIKGPEKIDKDTLHKFVAGAVITNDVSARCVQIPQMQFYKGKSYRTFGPTGPWLTLFEEDDFTRLADLHMTLSVNGAVRQNAYCREMVFSPVETLSELSGCQDFEAGDLLATGTPAGVALQLPRPFLVKVFQLLPDRKRWSLFTKKQKASGRYLQPGDKIVAAIHTDDMSINLGTQCNTIVQSRQT